MISFTPPLTLRADRWTLFSVPIRLAGIDLTGATMAMEIRQKPDTPGTPLISLVGVGAANAEGIYLAGVETVDGVKISTVQIHINESTMENPLKALPANEAGEDVELAWDIHLAPSAGLNPGLPVGKRRYLGGPFIIRGGTTGVNP